MAKGQFDLNDLRAQLQQMQRMGGLGALAGMMPGMGKIKNQINASGVLEGNVLGRLDAIISSMTPKERGKPELMNAKRKIRVAKGSGTTVQEVNKLLKMHQEMATRDEEDPQDGRPRQAGRAVRRRRHGRHGRPGGMPDLSRGCRPAACRGFPGGRRRAVQLPEEFQEIIVIIRKDE